MAAAPSAGPYVGRVLELGAISDCLQRAQRAAATVLIEGEAGIGKTRLLSEALTQAQGLDFQVASGSGQELERSRPFGVLADALGLKAGTDPQRAAIAERLRGEGADGPSAVAAGPGAVYRIVEDVVDLVERMTSAGPVVLAVEDLQWADPSTLLTLHAAVRRLWHLPLLIVGTFRPAPVSAELRQLVEALLAVGAMHLALGPLAAPEVHTLASAVAGAPPGPRLRTQLERAEGNPLYVIELVRALADEGVLQLSGGQAEAARPSLPSSLRLMLLRRLGYLPGSTLDVLRMAAMLGSSFEVAQLALVTKRPVVELTAVLDEALHAGVLREAGPRLAFRHDLIREALYTDLALPIRNALHLEVGRALAAAGAQPIQVAQHLTLGAARGDEEAVTWLREAALQAQPQAPAVAAELLERALEIAGPHDASRDTLTADLVLARLWSGRPDEAETQAREALGRPHDVSVETALRLGLLESLLAQGKAAEVGDESRAAVSHPGLAGWARVRLLAEAAFGSILTADLEGGVATADGALREADHEGDDLAACIALCALCTAALFEGRLPAGVAHAAAAVERAARSGTAAARTFHSYAFLGWSLGVAERTPEALQALRRGRRLAEDMGTFVSLPIYHCELAWLHFLTGDWDDVVAEGEAGLALTEELASHVGVSAVHSILALVALHRGDRVRAERGVGCAQAQREGAFEPLSEFVALASAHVAEAKGDMPGALAALAAAWDTSAARRAVIEQGVLGPDLVRLLVATGDRDRAQTVAAHVEEVASRMGARWARAAALRCRGLADADADALLQAVTVLRAAPRPLELAAGCEEAAAALTAIHRSAEAAPLLNEALAAYEKLGAVRDIARAEAGLRSLGHRSRRRGWRQRHAKTGWDALTRTELDVVGHVGEGLTNREVAGRLYISPRTVESHLSHVFAKLGVSSRVELRAELARRSPAE